MPTDRPPTVLLMTSLWEYQCCGDPISVGEVVEFSVSTMPSDPVFQPLFSQPLTRYASRHSIDASEVELVGRVVKLWEGRADVRETPTCSERCPGTGRITPITTMVPWDERWAGQDHVESMRREPACWILEVEELPGWQGEVRGA